MAKIDPKLLNSLKKEIKRAKKTSQSAQQAELKASKEKHRENSLFHVAIKGTRKMRHDRVVHETDKPAAKRLKRPDPIKKIIRDPLSDELPVDEVEPTEVIYYRANGVQNRVFRNLRRGAYPVSDELDLHGLNQRAAKQALVHFLQEVIQFENCCVRIIHGKGHRSRENKPVLKAVVNHWLREHDRVLAFHTTKPADGGAGAVYVLLKTTQT